MYVIIIALCIRIVRLTRLIVAIGNITVITPVANDPCSWKGGHICVHGVHVVKGVMFSGAF